MSDSPPDTARMLPPDNRLQQKLGKHAEISALICANRVEKAKEAVASRAGEFATTARQELDDLEALFNEAVHGQDVSSAFTAFTDGVLNLKGQAGICGYQLATEVARLLHGFCLKASSLRDREQRIVRVHLDALRAIFRDQIKGEGGVTGETLLRDLRAVVQTYDPK